MTCEWHLLSTSSDSTASAVLEACTNAAAKFGEAPVEAQQQLAYQQPGVKAPPSGPPPRRRWFNSTHMPTIK